MAIGRTHPTLRCLDSDSDSDFELPRRPSIIGRELSSLRNSCKRVKRSMAKITFTKARFLVGQSFIATEGLGPRLHDSVLVFAAEKPSKAAVRWQETFSRDSIFGD